MKPERWEMVAELYHSALAKKASERGSFLEAACAGDHELQKEVESLLAQETGASWFMETPALDGGVRNFLLESFEPHQNTAGAKCPEGSRLGPYEIIGLLGAGGMGDVYRARDVRLGREVAVKVLSSNISVDLHGLQRFEREARAVALLNHPNICTLFDLGAQDGTNYIVMELLTGQTLKEVIGSSALDMRLIVRWGTQVASALQAAHSRGIIHRDVKPANIFITDLGIAKLLDFGLAKFLKPGAAESNVSDQLITAATMRGLPFGTVPYMSPEHARGQAVSPQSDLFSFGSVLYEMATGSRAFPGASAAEVLVAILDSDPIPATQLNAGLPGEMDQILARLLAKSPEVRYASASELIAELEILSDRGVSKTRVLPATPSQQHSERLQSIAVLPLLDLSPDAREDYFADGLTEALITAVARLGRVRVISRTSAMCYKNTTKSLAVIAQELNVDSVVEGSVVRSGERLRINCRLVDPRTEDPVWSESFDHQLGDILAVHDDLARAIASRLRTHVREHSHPTQETRRNINPESYDSWLRGRYFLNKRNEPNLRKAIEFFQHALDLDPCYAPAWVGIADSYINLGYGFGRMEPNDAMPKARAAALHALEVDPYLGDAHVSLGIVKAIYEWDYPAAEASMKRALELNPSCTQGHHLYAAILANLQRNDEALAQIHAGLRSDPLSLPVNNFVGMVHFTARHYDLAIAASRKTLEMAPNFGLAHSVLGASLEAKGLPSQAAEEYLTALELEKRTPEECDGIRRGYESRGLVGLHEEDLKHMLRRWDGWHASMVEIAALHAGLGHVTESLDWLEKACDARSGRLTWIRAGTPFARIGQYFDNLCDEPRFLRILERLQLPI